MLQRKPRGFAAIAVGCCAFGAEIAACSSASAPPSTSAPIPVASCTDGGLTVAFSPMYSAFDGTHTFLVPAVVRGSNGNVTWSADSRMVGMQVDQERPNEVLIQMLKAGNVVINVQSDDGKCGSSLLFISAAAESDWEIGNARYNDGRSLNLAAGATPGNGSPLEGANGAVSPACTSCHGETATKSAFTDVSHTPEQTGGFSDEDLLNIILRGDFPDGGYFDKNIVNYAAWHNFHRWADIKPDQQKGIITYLRSLTPRDQKGAVNFGAFDTASDSGDDTGDATVSVETGAGEDAAPVDAAVEANADAKVDVDADANVGENGDAGLDAGDHDGAAVDASDSATE